MSDTNLVVSAFLSPGGAPARVLEGWRQEAFDLLVSEPILAEYQRALGYERVRVRHRMTPREIAEVVDGFRRLGVLVEPGVAPRVIEEDPEDDKFLAAALAGDAEYIVSGDSHLLKLREYRGIQILPPGAFLALLDRWQP